MDRKKLEASIAAFLATQDTCHREEWDDTPQNLHKIGLNNFTAWLYAAEDAKAARHKQYLLLKSEFEHLTLQPHLRCGTHSARDRDNNPWSAGTSNDPFDLTEKN